jgi:sec-independent protein translocase protein TatA
MFDCCAADIWWAGEEDVMEGLFQPTHLIFILLIVLILFGPGKLPELGKGLGKGIREFKDAIKGGMEGSSEKKEEEKKT